LEEKETVDPKEASPSNAEIYLGSTEMAPGLDRWFQSNQIPLIGDPSLAQAGLLAAKEESSLIREMEALEGNLPDSALIFSQAVTVDLGRVRQSLKHPDRLIGFDSMSMAQAEVVALTANRQTSTAAKDEAEALFLSWGKKVVWVTEGPGLVLPRIMAMLVNEAAFALQEGVATGQDIDRAMKLGVGYPWGPLAWGRKVGYRLILEVLDFLKQEQGDPRYRAALILRGWANEEYAS
jgi:3-hydroxybutyryl-CoA dehydrogenase